MVYAVQVRVVARAVPPRALEPAFAVAAPVVVVVLIVRGELPAAVVLAERVASVAGVAADGELVLGRGVAHIKRRVLGIAALAAGRQLHTRPRRNCAKAMDLVVAKPEVVIVAKAVGVRVPVLVKVRAGGALLDHHPTVLALDLDRTATVGLDQTLASR